MSNVLTVAELTKTFSRDDGSAFTAVNNISFELGQGEILGILGPNGAGKTTLIQMLLSTLTISSGSVVYFGKNFFAHRSLCLQDVGFASTYVSMPGNFSVRANLMLHGRLYGLHGKELKQRVEKYLSIFDVFELSNQETRTLSAGQKTRVMLAKAFMTHPKIVLLDEPTASLDPDIASTVRSFIVQQQKNRGVSILLTSHNMDEVTEVCSRVLVMRNGKIIASDTPEALAARVSTAKLELVVGDGLKRTVAYAVQQGLSYVLKGRVIEIVVVEQKVAEFLSGLAAAGVLYTQISINKPTLEDYFMHIARGEG